MKIFSWKHLSLLLSGVLLGFLFSWQLTAFANRPAALPLAEIQELSEVISIIKTDYVEPVEEKQLFNAAIAGMVASLDPHSVYLDKKTFKELRESTQGSFVGLGIEIGMEEGLVKVISPIDDSPAQRAGLLPLDFISRIDQTQVKGLSLDEAVKRMRGLPGTKVTLTILRKGEKVPLLITIEREEIRIQSVKSKEIEPNFGWVRISQFQERTVDDLVTKLNELATQNPALKGLVVDLRNNPGGLLPAAIGVTGAFIKAGDTVVTTNGQLTEQKIIYPVRPEFYSSAQNADPLLRLNSIYKTLPIVVLVNAGSASASEIVAGALQDYQRAKIFGTVTFGKGSVQTIRLLSPDTGIKLTTARYYTPKGRSIQAKGIEPDIVVDARENERGTDDLQVREADLQKHLSNTTTADDSPRELTAEAISRLEKSNKPLEFGSPEDFQLKQALNQLKGLPVIASKFVTPKPTVK